MPPADEINTLLTTALAQHQAGRLAAASVLYRQCLVHAPAQADALHLLGVADYQQGNPALAERHIRAAIHRNPLAAAYRSNLCLALRDLGHSAAAVRAGVIACLLQPNSRDGLNNLGRAWQDQRQPVLAETCYRRALRLDPVFAEANNNLGLLALDLGRTAVAQDHFERALAHRPTYAEAHNNLATLLQKLGAMPAAILHHRRALSLRPDYAESLNNLGNAWRDLGQTDRAISCFTRALTVDPTYPDACNNLGNVYQDQGRFEAALACFERVLAGNGDNVDALNNRAGALMGQGRLGQALQSFGDAVAQHPEFAKAHSNLIMSLHYAEQVGGADIFAQARRFAAHWEAAPLTPDFANRRDPLKRLKVGYVSADFQTHPVGFFLAGVLESHDAAQVEVTCYSNSHRHDGMTGRLRRAAHHWRDIAGRCDAEVAAMIAEDGIDLLIDLSGHTGDNRLTLFARKPAPLQLSWLGYFGTTGLSRMDYVLADDIVAPAGDESCFSETIVRLPGCYLCYTPHDIEVPVAPSPCLVNGHVTFGCFNNGSKISDGAVALWAQILRRCPNARLFLKTRILADAEARSRLRERFAACGIPGESLILEGHSPLAEAMAAYNRVDVALDPFPFGGCTTTAETLWMGVPLVALRGARWTGRMSHSILARLGLESWVARSPADYVDIATRLAAEAGQHTAPRLALRQRLLQSDFCDVVGFTHRLEQTYRALWQDWCHAQGR